MSAEKTSFYHRLLTFLDRRLFHRIYADHVRKLVLQSIPFWIASVLTGLVAVGYERIFSWAETICRHWIAYTPVRAFLITPLSFLAAWGCVYLLAPAARGSGIPQLMAAIDLATPSRHQRIGYLLGLRVAFVKIVSSAVLLLGGGAIGREGPTIQIAGALFQVINRLQPKGWPQLSRKIALITGGAAGLAAAFNTPLGGIVFVVEELTQTHITRFRTAIFTAVIIAGMTAQAILGPYLYLGYPPVPATGWTFLGVAFMTALICGLAGALFGKLLLWLNSRRKRWSTLPQQVVWVTGCGLLMAILIYFAGDYAAGTGKPLINHLLFRHPEPIPWYVFPARIATMALSYSSGAAGGVFATSLSAGAVLGNLTAELTHIAPKDLPVVVLVGMVSFLTGVVRSPFTAAILVLEMTDRHSAIFPLLLGGLTAQLVATIVDPHSLYEHLKHNFFQEALHAGKATEAPEKSTQHPG
ncbi:chloride channel protein [Arsenicibacter rosenii]|uniref:Chloride channel protein n=1 Tax=Arsenicibacter rosenii TaxID=1750698 RepID=A0A1S2VRI1_9BACT|nr:chloride channel protein [Arsenicibacter rosenii]OIN60905.1 chloride channel protein [Arsenicibacter rosenii]